MWVELALCGLAAFLFLYWYVVKNFGKWEALGVPCVSGSFPYGSHATLVTQSKHFNTVIEEDYHRFKESKVSGLYMLGKPVLIINDLDLIRLIMVKDFDHFVDRNDRNMDKMFGAGGDMDQLWAKQMTSLSGDAWKDLRSTFTPIFTSGKMKGMLQFIQEVGESLTGELGKKADAGVDFELKEVFGKFSLDTLASCAFGINPRSFETSATSSVFVKSAARIFTNTFGDNIKAFSRILPGAHHIHRALGINILKPRETRFFVNVLTDTIRQRRETGARRNDMIDLMVDCMTKEAELQQAEDNVHGQDQYEADMKFEHRKKAPIEDDAIVATAMILLIAGYDTTGMTLSFLSYYLADQPDIQARLQDEIDTAYEDNDGQLPDYQTIQELPYLEACILETVRMFSPVGFLLRCCVKDYTLPGVGLELKVNDAIIIPAAGIHRDPAIYPNPTVFNPDHFSKEARQGRSPYAFQGFGQGPRACIGMRFAMLEMKVGMMEVLRRFTFHKSAKNPAKHTVDPHSQLGYVKEGLYVKIERRN